jgi:tripartite-type tricarboxylate transporter receptor subunit TctC
MKIFKNSLKILICIFSVLSFIGASNFSIALETYPSKAVVLNVGYAAGGSCDLTTRAYAPVMEKIWGQPVVVANKPGASAAIMMEFIRHSSPDGYNLGVYATGALTGPHLKEVPYDFFKDYTHIAQLGDYDMGLLVNTSSPWKTAKELVEYGQKNPGKLRFSSSGGIGTSSHLLSEQFGFMNNFKWVHVPFDGDATATAALLGNHIDVSFQPLTSCAGQVKAGRLRLLLVFYENRSKDFPDVPTTKESGYKPYFYKLGVYGICGPKNLPTPITEKILSTVKAASKDPNVMRIMEKQYLRPTFRGGEEWISYLKESDEEEVAAMKKIGLKVIK